MTKVGLRLSSLSGMKTAHVRPALKSVIASSLFLLLAGCATSGGFSCNAPDGVSCMSTPELYEMTNGYGAGQVPQPEKNRRVRASRGAASGKAAAHQVSATGDALALSAPVQSRGGSFNESALSLGASPRMAAAGPHLVGNAPDAIGRMPAQVMRIWVAPWTDAIGDLHMPSFVYTEITNRRWSIGGDVRNPAATSSFDPHGPWTPTSQPSFNP